MVKGTEFFDGKTQRYVDFPITDVLQVRFETGTVYSHYGVTSQLLVHTHVCCLATVAIVTVTVTVVYGGCEHCSYDR